MQKTLIFLGVALVLAGLLWPWLSKVPFGRLPGDIIIDKPGFKLFFPITSMLLVRKKLKNIFQLQFIIIISVYCSHQPMMILKSRKVISLWLGKLVQVKQLGLLCPFYTIYQKIQIQSTDQFVP